MAAGDDRSPNYPPPAKRQKKTSTTTAAAASSLGLDVLLEIFMRLPSLATLVRAALTCRAWRRAVASSPDFRRRFRETHPAPLLLGLFFDPPDATSVQAPAIPIFPTFVPARAADDRDHTAAVRGGDFFLLTSLQERPGGCWDIHDCRGGYILVGNRAQKVMAVLNPLARRSERFFDFGHGSEDTTHHGNAMALDARLLCSEENPKSFRVVRATVFSSDTGDWSILPWVDVLPIHPPMEYKPWLLNSNMRAKGLLYWVYSNRKHMLTLDTATMDFSVAELPKLVMSRECSFAAGETIDGRPCVVYALKFGVCLFFQRIDEDGVKRWLMDKPTSLGTQLDAIFGKLKDKYSELKVMAVSDGFAYLATSLRYHCAYATTPSWVLSLCLETMKLEKLFQRPYEFESCVHPYVMSWPLSLVGNYGRFALKDSP
ncbi:hypothetical protein HU200_050112 [Digitaria exilis]|uniref:F-box domain-containing protein n=1 Tax=Digitaria exilis TaxID=1010633 RepID=A0A835E7N7_9POAL|nr:hypothetical protein HU200_050112 [Digitaria exilis]